MQIQIRNRWDQSILFEGEYESFVAALTEAIRKGADLRSANLRSANLYGADLYGADLYGANLYGADLRSANLRSANLRSANLYGANLYGADLRSANLRSANLYGANLYGANLYGADLYGADLYGANLYGADLRSADLGGSQYQEWMAPFKHDLWAVLLHAQPEVPALRQALVDGKVNGSTYTGQCACLVGTIAKARQCDYTALGALVPDGDRPAERWFLGINEGDVPEKNHFAALALQWVDEFQALIVPPAKPKATKKISKRAASR